MVDRTLSLCITTFNRDDLLLRSFDQVLDDERVSEIVIVDDLSNDKFIRRLKTFDHPKLKIFFNQKNLGCYRNKHEAIKNATNEYVIIFDSDNIISKKYIDKIFENEWHADTIYAPDYVHSFDYRHFSGLTFDRTTAKNYIGQTRFDCIINTMNYFVHRQSYLDVWDGSIEPWTADTIYQNYNWLKSGRKIHVLKELEYIHKIEDYKTEEKSHYIIHNRKTGNLFNETMKRISRL